MEKEIRTGHPFRDNSRMPFGKYRGIPLKNIEASYLLWLYNDIGGVESKNPLRVNLKQYINDNRAALEVRSKEERIKFFANKYPTNAKRP